MKAMDSQQQEVYDTLLELLHSIKSGDVETYTKLSSDELTCIEPETGGHLVEGLPFHTFLVERSPKDKQYHIEVVNPAIRVYGDTAYAAYTLTNSFWKGEGATFSQFQETRIFRKIEGTWVMVHFHRS
jgi:calcium/calmodulin-dependent protein kinase (CaM kinase) II